jgi:serine/threonine-protein kinase
VRNSDPLEEIPVTETLETPKEELTTGSTFAGRYQIIEELGKGGMGKVYKAQDTDLKEKVAIKLLKPEIAADKKTIERFRNELKFARKIRHKNVCQMYDLNKEEGAHYITMEYVPGEDLKGMIRMMGQLGAGKSISIAKQVCEGLAEAHDRQRRECQDIGFWDSPFSEGKRNNCCWSDGRDARVYVS